jgi:hypothetical protein
MDIEQDLLFTAHHEALHALYAFTMGFKVDHIVIHPKGETLVHWPVQPRDLFWNYKNYPMRSLRQLRGMIGVLISPGTLMAGEYVRGGDLDLLMRLKAHWHTARRFTTPSGPQWLPLRTKAGLEVLAWYQVPGRTKQVEAIIESLLEHNELDGPTFNRLAAFYKPQAERATTYAYAS